MNVGQVIELAREWVEVHGSQTPGFCGAHLMGTLNFVPHEAPFAAYKDVDFNIVLEGGEGWVVHDFSYRGRIMECGHVSADAYHSPQAVLTDPSLAPNLAAKSILSDPQGLLTPLHETVAREYPWRKWVRARCDAAKSSASGSLERLGQAGLPAEAVLHLGTLILGLSGLVAIANLTPPTHRRSLVRMKKVLAPWGWADLQEQTLRVYGFAHFSRAQAKSYLEDCAATFDRATEVTRTPIPFGAKLKPHVRPYAVEGAREMIAEGHHREAMSWIVAMLWIANTAIQIDAPEEDKPRFQAKLDRLFPDMGLRSQRDVQARFREAKELVGNVQDVADEIVKRHREIIE